jgi:hypothetical protein
MPLYTFAEDRAPGEAKGQGIKDVGTWKAVTVGTQSSSAPAATTPAEPAAAAESESSSESSGGGGGYSY